MKIEIKPGLKFGMLTVLRELEPFILPSGQKNRKIECQCDCGKITNVRLLHLVRYRSTSCGCTVGEKHNECNSKLYNTWRALKNRCNKNYFQKHLYFTKDIDVFDDWKKSYLTFREWALKNGFKEGLQIDRIDNSKGYYPENCRFVDQITNMNNRDNTLFVTYNGEKRPISILLREKGLFEHRNVICSRIKRGWTVNDAIDIPIRKGNYKKN